MKITNYLKIILLFFIVILRFAVVENSPNIQEDEFECEPGRAYKVDCNTCSCTERKLLLCTLIGCSTHTGKAVLIE